MSNMDIDDAIAILRTKLSHVTREYRPEDEALDVLIKASKCEHTEPNFNRFLGSEHIVPLADCPMCGGATDFIEFPDQFVWYAECDECGLTLGEYSSRLDLCNDWNRRVGE